MTATPEQKTSTQTALQPIGGGGVIVVDRNERQTGYGQGIAKGMATVMNHFVKAFTKNIDDKSVQTGMFTV